MLRFNLHKKVLGALLLLSLFPLGLLLFNSQHSLRSVEDILRQQTTAAFDSQATKALENRTQMVAAQVGSFLREVEGDLLDLSLLQPTEQAYQQFSQRHTRQLWYRQKSEQGATETRQSTVLYQELAYIDSNGNEKLRIVNGAPLRHYRNVADPAFTTYKTEEYYQHTAKLATGQVWVSRLYGWHVGRDDQLHGSLEKVLGTPYRGVIRFATPIRRAGKLLGIVVLSLDHRHLMEFTQHISPVWDADVVTPSYSSGNYAFMFDDKGWMIAHPKYWDIRGYDDDGELVPAYSSATVGKDIVAEIKEGHTPY